MCTPVFTLNDFVITFEAEPEDHPAYDHFRKECGWKHVDAMRVSKYPFFCAHVRLFRDGEMLADTYLGACSYKTEKEFYTVYKGDYFADMVHDVFYSAGFLEEAETALNLLRI